MLGVLSFLTVDLEAVVALLPGASMAELPFSPFVMKLVSLIQPSVLLAIAVAVGVAFSHRVGLHSPVAEAAARGEPVMVRLRPQILPGVIAGILVGVALLLLWVFAKPMMPPELAARAEAFNRVMPVAFRLLYGGFTEELLLRWGVMTFFVWLPWRIFRKAEGRPSAPYFVVAILASALLFAIGHLPVVVALAETLTAATVVFVIAGNSLFGIAAGFLYWKRGLESAMVAHITTHIILLTAISLTSK
jgi:hypothetical protein